VSRRPLVIGLCLTLILTVVAGCGRRGALEQPGGNAVAEPVSAPPLIAPVPSVTVTDDPDEDRRDIGAAPGRVSTASPYGEDWEYKAKRSVVMTPPPPNRVPKEKSAKPFVLDSLIN